MKTLALVTCLGILAIGAASAQETPRFAFSVGAGFTTPVGNTGRQLDDGWNVGGGFGMNFSPYVGALIDLDYNSFAELNSKAHWRISACPAAGCMSFRPPSIRLFISTQRAAWMST